jgi:hypothetical protein
MVKIIEAVKVNLKRLVEEEKKYTKPKVSTDIRGYKNILYPEMFHLSTKVSRYENNIIALNIFNIISPCSYLKIFVTLYSNNLKNIITTPRLRKLTTLPFHKAPSGT